MTDESKSITLTVGGSRPYQVMIGSGLLRRSGSCLRGLFPSGRACVIADDTVASLYGSTVTESLRDAGFDPRLISFPHGEENKNLQTLGRLLEESAHLRFTRSDFFVALGGGVTGDIAGLCAALYLRGIPCVQMPTTLLAAVDSSVGGKTAVDLDCGKNLVGAFWPPAAVLCDTDVLQALPPELLRDGSAEVLKYGLLCDRELFGAVAAGISSDVLDAVTARCVTIKKDYVERDERDTGVRQMLNLGHTFGHAVELCSGYRWTHGQAVGLGLLMACRYAAMPDTDRVQAALLACGLPTRCPFPADVLAEAALHDKKRGTDTVTLILPDSIGHCHAEKVPSISLPAIFAKALGENA